MPEPEPEKIVCPTYSCGDLADFQCTRGRSVVKFELEKTEYALFPSLIHQVTLDFFLEHNLFMTIIGWVQYAHVWRQRIPEEGLSWTLFLLCQCQKI